MLGIALVCLPVLQVLADDNQCKPVSREHFAERLIAAGFNGASTLPSALDVTVYVTAVPRPLSREKVEAMVKDMYAATDAQAVHPLDSPEGQAEMDAEVQRILREQAQRKPRRFFRRIRVSGNRIRVDETQLSDQVEFRPDLAFEITRVQNGKQTFRYYHKLRSADVSQGNDCLLSSYRKDLDAWFGVPGWVRNTAFLLFGDTDEYKQHKKSTVDPDAKKAFVEKGEMRLYKDLSIEMCRVGGQLRDHIELTTPEKDGERLITILECDHNDYKRLYELSMHREPGSRLVFMERREYDKDGMLRRLITEAYNPTDGTLLERKDIQVVQIHVNTPLDADIFEWNPPKGYLICDRQSGDKKILDHHSARKEH